MSLLLVAGALVAGGFVIVLLLAPWRPRTAQAMLDRPPAATPSIQAGSQPLCALLDSLAKQRATGILTVTAGEQSASICFLFGHIFHAVAGPLQGEDALRAAMGWPGARSEFEPKTQLPTVETITRPTQTVLAELAPDPSGQAS